MAVPPPGPDAFIICVFTCAAGCVLTLLGEARGNPHHSLTGKIVAASAYVAAALSLGAGYSDYGRLMLGGMFFCWLGDLLLVSRRNRALFLGGLTAFLVGHVFYSVAFLARGVTAPLVVLAAAVMLVFAVSVFRWLLPHLVGAMRLPVAVYVATISLMMVLAAATSGAPGGGLILVGAALFVISDLLVARNRFVSPGLLNRVAGLPLYFSAQLLLAASVVH